MKLSLASLAVAVLAFVANPGAVISADTNRHLVASVDIIVDGTPQHRYLHDGRWYVEALKGREYAIRLRNPYGVRVAVALSVDGLNTIDARHTAAADARKWVLDPYEVVTISGWQTSRTEARRFEFTTEQESYAQALGKPFNMGVISAVFFRERVPAIAADARSKEARRGAPAPPSAPSTPGALSAPSASPSSQERAAAMRRDEEYAATGMGRPTDHVVRQVWLDLEDAPAQTVDIRYEYRPQLVRLGILPSVSSVDPLRRRERAQGFEPGYSPEPPRRR